MKIIVQQKLIDKHTDELVDEEVALDDDGFEGHNFVTLSIGDTYVEIPIRDLFTAVEAFHRHEVRDDEEQLRLRQAEIR